MDNNKPILDSDKVYLDSRIFTAFSETSKSRYIYVCNMEIDVSRWSKTAVEYFGLPGEYMRNAGKIWEQCIHPDDRLLYHTDIEAVFNGEKDYHDVEYRVKNRDGKYVVCTCKGFVLKGENGEPDLFAGSLTNHGIVDNVDPTTGLYNIYEFLSFMRVLCQKKEKAMLIEIGINHFSDINNIHSYVFGNKILQAFAEKVKVLIYGRGYIYRLDGAKFALCMQDMSEEQAQELYKRIQSVAANGISVEGMPVGLSLSAGAVHLTGGGYVGEYSLQSSLAYALESSKNDKLGELIFFDNVLQNSNRQTMAMLNTIRQSVLKKCSGFYLCYQPLIDVKTDKPMGMEALIRWKGKIYGEVSPCMFIPWLENDACFFELGSWILMQAMHDARPIVDKNPDFVLNVNVSYSQFSKTGFRDSVIDILHITEFPPQNLCIELTERCKGLNLKFLQGEMEFFKDAGIKIALDDFGTGFSSLNLLRELPIDCLKIDQTFISGILTNKTDQIIVETVVSCAKKLNIEICIEGIETEEIRDFVNQYNPELYQGYYYSKPVTIDKLLEYINKPN